MLVEYKKGDSRKNVFAENVKILVSSQNFIVKLNFNLAKLSVHKDLRFDKKAFTMLF